MSEPTLPSFAPVLLNLTLATLMGILVGIEREFSHRKSQGHLAGVRTFGLMATLGFLGAHLSMLTSPWVFVAALLGASLLTATAYFASATNGDRGLTTEIALLITFGLGALVQFEATYLAATIAVLVTLLLSLKPTLHAMVGKLSEEDLFALIKFVLLAAVVIPVLPSHPIDPWGVIRPQHAGGMVVIVLSVTFLGYLLAKFWDVRRGILVTGLLGGLVSSTAVAWVLSRRSSEDSRHSTQYGIATLLSVAVMLPRVGLLAWLVQPHFARTMATPLVVMGLTLLVFIGVFLRTSTARSTAEPTELQLGNPFELSQALKFTLLFLVILAGVAYAKEEFGTAGILTASFLAGIADVDAITLSMAQLSGTSVLPTIAAAGALLALLVNNAVKLVLAYVRGSREYRRVILPSLGASIAVGIVTSYLLLRPS